MSIDWIAREELEAEYWGYYDSINEAYAATAEDARKFAESEAEYWNDYFAQLEEENHQAHVYAYDRHLAEKALGVDEHGNLDDIPF